MKLVIFTTCKPLIGDDKWRQEQAIKSWTLLKGMEIIIIIIGNDEGVKELCEKYNLIHEPHVRNIKNVPFLHDMLEIGVKYSEPDDYLLWTNSDMIYYQHMIENIIRFKYFRKVNTSIQNFALVGGRTDWHNPKILKDISYNLFISNLNINNKNTTDICQTNSSKYECSYHALCGIDYVIHSPTTFINKIDKQLVIAGTRHDMILVGTSISNNYYTCNITDTNPVIHQNHGYPKGYTHMNIVNDNHHRNNILNVLKYNNMRCNGIMKNISDAPYKTFFLNNIIHFTDLNI